MGENCETKCSESFCRDQPLPHSQDSPESEAFYITRTALLPDSVRISRSLGTLRARGGRFGSLLAYDDRWIQVERRFIYIEDDLAVRHRHRPATKTTGAIGVDRVRTGDKLIRQ
jgi:hypothetical protein